MRRKHGMPFGAEIRSDASVRFRLWAPAAKSVNVMIEQPIAQSFSMSALDAGWFEFVTDEVAAGARFCFQIDGEIRVPDLASRYQPADVHGPSEVVDPCQFDWQDGDWRGRAWHDAVIYEIHVGAFTQEGTFAAIERKLDYLVDLGISAIELMPVADFPGGRNWGYDGVLPFAPDSSYGSPNDLKRLVQAAHAKGLMILLDVVYNHFGPEGNYIRTYAPDFFTDRHRTPWGDGINYDGPGSPMVREFMIHNALYWLEEYHFDGLRLDAVHSIADDSDPDILTELAERVRSEIGSDRHIHLVLENDDNRARYLQREGNRPVLYDAQWNDDIHHALHVLATKEKNGYYIDYSTEPVCQLTRCLSEGFAYQGEASQHRGNRKRGEPSRHLPPAAFVSFMQNHDQVGNRAFGERIHQIADPCALKAALAIVLLAPGPPLLFMGEEFGASSPFLYFCDFESGLAEAVRDGRRSEFAHFAEFSSRETRAAIPDPNDADTFQRSKLDWRDLTHPDHERWLDLYRELLMLRRTVIVPRVKAMTRNNSTATCTDQSLLVDWELTDRATLRVIANLSAGIAAPLGQPLREIIYSTHKHVAEHREMGPWNVIWSLHP